MMGDRPQRVGWYFAELHGQMVRVDVYAPGPPSGTPSLVLVTMRPRSHLLRHGFARSGRVRIPDQRVGKWVQVRGEWE